MLLELFLYAAGLFVVVGYVSINCAGIRVDVASLLVGFIVNAVGIFVDVVGFYVNVSFRVFAADFCNVPVAAVLSPSVVIALASFSFPFSIKYKLYL